MIGAMSPLLSLVVAGALAGAEPVRHPVELLAMAIEVEFGASRSEAAPSPLHGGSVDVTLWYGPATGDEAPFFRRATSAAPATRSLLRYDLALPIFRDLP